MQRGLATLEIIIAVAIVAAMGAVAIPNIARMLDRAALEYEYRKLYSDLRYLQATGRSGNFNSMGTGRNDLTVKTENLPTIEFDTTNRSWKLLRGGDSIREEHFLSDGVEISPPNGKNTITFDLQVRTTFQGTITLSSRYGEPYTIRFDSVGRITGKRGLPDD